MRNCMLSVGRCALCVRTRILPAILAAVLLGAAMPAPADEAGDAARTITEKHADCVVPVKLVIKQEMSFSGREGMKQEDKSEVIGTMIDPSGLCVVSLSATDPAGTMRRLMQNMSMGRENQMEFNTQLSDIKLILPSKKEVAAEVVLRDRDLDLAFVRPVEPLAEPVPAVDPKDSAKPRIMDQVVILNRLGQVANRTPIVSLGRVAAVVDRPRTFYVIDQPDANAALGAPVFAIDGKPIGVVVLRTIDTQASGGWAAMFSGGSSMGILPIVLPYESILESAGQVPARGAKSEESADKTEVSGQKSEVSEQESEVSAP